MSESWHGLVDSTFCLLNVQSILDEQYTCLVLYSAWYMSSWSRGPKESRSAVHQAHAQMQVFPGWKDSKLFFHDVFAAEGRLHLATQKVMFYKVHVAKTMGL